MALEIERILDSRFEFSLDGGDPISDNAPNLTTFGNICHFKTKNGASIIKNQNIIFSDVVVIDTFGGTGVYIPDNIQNLWIKLISIKFFAGVNGSPGGGGVTRFDALLDTFTFFGNDGKVPVVDEAQSKLIATEFYNINTFLELTDVEISSLINEKIVGVTLVEGVPKITLVDKPVDGTTYFSAVGGFDYDDLATKTTPLVYTSGDLQLKNDILGPSTYLSQPPYGITEVWDESTNTFNFSQLSEGDEVFLRININHTTSSANQKTKLFMQMTDDSAITFNVVVDENIYDKTAGLNNITRTIHFYVRDAWKNNPVYLYYNSDGNSTISVNGWHPYIIRKSINILDVNDDNFKTFTISNIEANLNDASVNTGDIKLGYNPSTNKINSILFDLEFSKYISNIDALKDNYTYFLNFLDKTNNNSFTSNILTYTLSNGYYLLTLAETIDFSDFVLNDKIEVYITPSFKELPFGDTLVNNSVVGAFDLDWSLYSAWILGINNGTLTLSDLNLPPLNKNQLKTIYFKQGLITDSVIFPDYYVKDINSDNFKGDVENRCVIESLSGGIGTEIVKYSIQNIT